MRIKNIFLTGATGFLGSHLLKIFLEKTDSFITLLIRAENKNDATNRIRFLLQKIAREKDVIKFIRRIDFVYGDQTEKNFGISKNSYNNLLRKVEEIYHCAALAEFNEPWEKVKLVNVLGTENILKFAIKCKNFRKMNHISSAFIAGNKTGIFREKDLDVGQVFNNTYERSKFEAELLVEEFRKKKLTIDIFRPSIVVGEYDTGETTNFRMFYKPFRSISLGLFSEMPLNVNTALNLIPVDYAAEAIFILSNQVNKSDTYHIVSPTNFSLLKLMNFAGHFFKYKNPKFVSQRKFNFNFLTYAQRKILDAYLPYLTYKTLFDSRKTQAILKKNSFTYPKVDDKFLFRIFNYCKKVGYIKSTR